MDKESIIKKLRENRDEIRKFGVKRLGIFGSVARGTAKVESDIDFIVEFEEGQKNFDNFINLVFFLESLFNRKVDLITPEGLSPYIKPYIEIEVTYERM